jgi:hypothetical protein
MIENGLKNMSVRKFVVRGRSSRTCVEFCLFFPQKFCLVYAGGGYHGIGQSEPPVEDRIFLTVYSILFSVTST